MPNPESLAHCQPLLPGLCGELPGEIPQTVDDVAMAGVWRLRYAVMRDVDGTEQLISGAPHLPQ